MPQDDKETREANAQAIERFVRGREHSDLPPTSGLTCNADDPALAQVEAYWNMLDAVKDDRAVLALRQQALARLADAAQVTAAANEDHVSERADRRRWTGPLMALAASLVLAVGTGTWIWLGRDQPPSTREVATEQLLENPVGPPRTWRLADNSLLTLDTGSRVSISPWGRTRSVRLERGSAYFQVAHDRSHPFIVASGENRVTALGTAFAVRVSSDATIVALSEGKVRVDISQTSGAAEQAFLTPGKRLSIVHGRWQMSELDAARDLGWRNGLLAFDNVSLANVIVQMNRYLVEKIPLPSDAAGARRISGVFRVDDREGFIRAIDALQQEPTRTGAGDVP